MAGFILRRLPLRGVLSTYTAEKALCVSWNRGLSVKDEGWAIYYKLGVYLKAEFTVNAVNYQQAVQG